MSIEAIKQAIEQAEKQEPVAYCAPEAIPRLKDSPSDWMVIYGRSQHPHNFPLYTEPPQREWVGLTDEEIEKMFLNNVACADFAIYAYVARTTQSKLKEKNHG